MPIQKIVKVGLRNESQEGDLSDITQRRTPLTQEKKKGGGTPP
jgi:hypothetical protein